MDKSSFDAQIESCLLRINEARRGPQGEWGGHLEGFSDSWRGTDDSHHVVPLPPGRLTVLLGRNGSGKTMMLRSLRHVGEQHDDLISSALLFTLPTESDDHEWALWAEEQLSSKPSAGRNSLFSILHRNVVGRLEDKVRGVKPGEATVMGLAARDALLFFGFSEDLVREWEERCDNAENEEKRGWPGCDLRKMSAEYILRGAGALPTSNPPNDIGSHYYERVLPGQQWLNDESLRDLIAPATQQFFESMTHFVVVGKGKTRLLAPLPEQGPLRDFMEQQSLTVGQHPEQVTDESGWLSYRILILPFPIALFRSFAVGGRPYVASFDLEVNPEDVLEVIDLSPIDDEQASEVALRRLGTLAFGYVTADETEDEISLTIRGVQRLRHVLEQVSDRLSRSNIGIAEVKLRWPPRGTSWIDESDFGDRRSWTLNTAEGLPSDMMPALMLKDAASGEWFDLEDASKGQIETLSLFLHLKVLSLDPLTHGFRRTILVCDEFDRSLHPAAGTAVLENLAEMATELDGVSVVVSTHNVAALGKPSLAGASRVYAQRRLKEFSFSESLETSLETMAEVLGSTFLDALKLKRLHILVEGNHDEIIIGDVLRDQIPEIRDVSIVNAHGLYAWTGLISNYLRFLDAPILLVHDKRDAALEEQWLSIRETFEQTDRLPDWGTTRFARMYADLKQRRSKQKGLKSDGELEKLLLLLRDNVFEWDHSLATRLHIFGLECDDVVDLLPPSAFIPKNLGFKSWDEAHDDFEERFPRSGGQRFKEEYGINDRTVRAAISATVDSVHPELVRLVGVVRSLLDGQPTQ